MRVSEPIYFRGKSDALSKKQQRSILGFKEAYPGLVDPHAFVRRRTTWDGTKFTGYSIPRVGEGVLPIRISKVYKSSPEVEEEGEDTLYMETGVSDPINVGAQNPLRLQPANWQIPQGWSSLAPPPNSGEYQGFFGDVDTVYTADNESLAVGEGTAPSVAAGAAVYVKKLIMGLFPPSKFTGMMRLYMQAYYGADNELDNQFSLQVTGGGEILLYVGDLQIGFWGHLSGGIARVGADDDLDFRYVTIAAPTGNTNYTVTEYPIVFDEVAAPARADYLDPLSSAADKEKSLAYLFAHSSINWRSPRVAGTFATTSPGTDVAYGWHFNNAGDKVAIALHETKTSGAYDYFQSQSVEVSFGTTVEDEQTWLTIDSLDEGTSGAWTPESNFQVWVPNEDFTTCSRALASLTNPIPLASFINKPTNIPIYCWYKEDDTLTIVYYSAVNDAYSPPEYVYEWTANLTPTADPVVHIDELRLGYVIENEARRFSRMEATSGTTVDIDIGSTNYELISYFGDMQMYDVPAQPSGATDYGASWPYIETTHTTYAVPETAPDVQDYNDAGSGTTLMYHNIGYMGYYSIGGDHFAYASLDLYIPDDAEAVYVGRLDYIDPDVGATRQHRYDNNMAVSQWVEKTSGGSPIYSNAEFFVWQDGEPKLISTTVDSEPVEEVYEELFMYIHSRTLDGDEGEYDGLPPTYFTRPIGASAPASKTFRESWGVAAVWGSDLGTLDDEYVEEGTPTGWI